MTTIRGSIDIARPVEEVFDTVADQRNELHDNPTMTRSVKVSDGPIDIGTVFDAAVRQLRLPWPARLAGFLVARVGERQEREIWSGLKRYLEERPS